MLFAHGYGMMGYGWGFGGIIIGSLFIILLIMLIIISIKSAFRIGKEKFGLDSALDILRKRYARGEITKAEFESIKKDIAE
jgi:putative membrane protein